MGRDERMRWFHCGSRCLKGYKVEGLRFCHVFSISARMAGYCVAVGLFRWIRLRSYSSVFNPFEICGGRPSIAPCEGPVAHHRRGIPNKGRRENVVAMAQKGGERSMPSSPLARCSMTRHVKNGWHEVPESRRFIGRFPGMAGTTGNHGDANAPFVDTSLRPLKTPADSKSGIRAT